MQAPNILFVMADQLAPHFTSTYGHPLVKTPYLDGLAERGVRFDAFYCHSPLCAPARFTMMSGRPVSSIGAWDNAAEFPASIPTFAHHLQLAGYRTILSGKMHFVGPDQMHGFEERLTTDVYPADFAWTPNWSSSDERIDKWYHNMDPLVEAGQAVTTHQIDYDEEVGYTARRKLLDLARDADDRPFLLLASFIHPHDPYVARAEWWSLYDHDDIDLPDPVDLSTLDPHSLRIRAGIEADTVGYSEVQTANARHGYYANVSYVDNWLGNLLITLDETGLADNTIIVFTADHGDMLGDRGLWYKMSFHERSARVPLVIAGPGVEPGTIPNAASHLDVLPTLLDMATNGDRSRHDLTDVEGRSLWPLATGDQDDTSEAVGEYTAEMTSRPIVMIRRDQFKYIHCDTDPPQLYDLDADPLERTNLAADPADAADADRAAAFAQEVADRWDFDAITERVVADQRARHTIHGATAATRGLRSWDHLPANDVANHYVRNHQDVVDAALSSRLPTRDDSATG